MAVGLSVKKDGLGLMVYPVSVRRESGGRLKRFLFCKNSVCFGEFVLASQKLSLLRRLRFQTAFF
jgi:hypothetical protein